MKIIDPHIHLFTLEKGNYAWLKKENPPYWPDKALINKNVSEEDLRLNGPFTLSGFVHIEAGFNNNAPWQELIHLQQHCQLPFKAISAIDLTLDSDILQKQLDTLKQQSSFIGVRHILDEQALALLTHPQVIQNISLINQCKTIADTRLVFEVQMPFDDPKAVKALCEIINKNVQLTFIINHAGLPARDTETESWQQWHHNLYTLSQFANVMIKCSGWEMIDRDYSTDWLNKNLSILFTLFGVKKMMLASNFPLCLFSKESYQAYWLNIFNSAFFQTLTTQEKSSLCYHNALFHYRMNV